MFMRKIRWNFDFDLVGVLLKSFRIFQLCAVGQREDQLQGDIARDD